MTFFECEKVTLCTALGKMNGNLTTPPLCCFGRNLPSSLEEIAGFSPPNDADDESRRVENCFESNVNFHEKELKILDQLISTSQNEEFSALFQRYIQEIFLSPFASKTRAGV
eukprot:Sdes_comp18414_c0_seq1m8265